MANDQHLAVLGQGVAAWNAWRVENPRIRPDFRGGDLSAAILSAANLRDANLFEANLSDINLGKVDLCDATLCEATLCEAPLCEANLSSEANLCRADLRRASLFGADLFGANLRDANLGRADLRKANLCAADLIEAYLRGANLIEANLSKAILSDANLSKANLSGAILEKTEISRTSLRTANLSEARLFETNFNEADLKAAELRGAVMFDTVLGNVDLSETKGVDTCLHRGPSIIDFRTLQRSGQLPLSFLRGCGLPDNLTDYLPSLLNQPIQFYSCFISYSSKDDEFARRLHADLQNEGIRCWFAPEVMKIGDRIRTRIDEVIRLHEKLLLVLSENSIDSQWVEKEVETAFEREGETKTTVLFPVRLDATVMDRKTGWAADIKRSRHIGDFSNWKNHDAYQTAFKRLLRDLAINQTTAPGAPG